nr:ral guanine nucleotide dissociation stimulator-like [Dasypus novemcinctus]
MYISIFVTYWVFTTTEQVLDWLFHRDSFHLFQMLSAIFSQSWELIIKEEICKFATLELKPTRAQKKVQQLKKEYQMITELQQLQAGCCYDSLMTNEQFGAWFGDMKQLSKKYR